MVTLDEGGWPESTARLSGVPPVLDPYVENAFTVDFRTADQRGWKILPDTCGHLLVEIRSRGGVGRVSIVGARRYAIEIDVTPRSWTIGVRFRPGGLAALAAVPAWELTDTSVQAGSLWGAAGDRFEADVRGATDPRLVRDRLLRFLQHRTVSASVPDWRAVSFGTLVRESRGTAGVEEAAASMGVPVRTLRAASNDFLGLAPKRFARIHRLFGAIAMGRVATWSRVAAACGFADQPHLIREFRNLLGETPMEYLARGRPLPIRSSPGAHQG